MTWSDARRLAKSGAPVRRFAWPPTRALVYWPPQAPNVAVIVTTTVASNAVTIARVPVRAADFGESEFAATDWLLATAST